MGSKFWVYFLSILLLWIATGLAVGGTSWFTTFLLFFSLQSSNGPIFFVTYAMAWLTFLSILYRRRSLGIRGFIIAGAAPFGGAGLYELVQDATGLLTQPRVWIFDPMGLLNLAAWVGLGLSGVFYWRLSRAWWMLACGYAASWMVWGLIGFPQITWGTLTQYPQAYVFNLALKIVSFVLFALPLWYKDRPSVQPSQA